MRKSFFGLVAGMVLAWGFPAPASALTAVDPVTFTFTDGCGYIDTKVTNNTGEPVQYKLATIISGVPAAMGPLEFTLAGGATATHRWLVRFHHGVRASSPAITGDIDHLYSAENLCNALWRQPIMQQDCTGHVLASIGAIEKDDLGEVVFAVNGKPGKPFPPAAPHVELIDGLHPGDVVSFLVPALSAPHELVTWYQTIIEQSRHCAAMPPVTVTFTCTGVNLKTVNTGQEERDLAVVAPATRTFPLAAGQALDEDFAATPGASVTVFWALPDFETGFNPAAALGIYARPQSCDASPAPPPGDGGPLPKTGAPMLLVATAGGLLLLLGAGLSVFTRRRRREPVA